MDRGVVKGTENGFAYIEMELNASCRSCANKAVCITEDKPARLKISNDYSLKTGDVVEIDLSPRTKLTAGFLLFILPVLLTFIGYYIGYITARTETSGMTGAVLGLIAGIGGVIMLSKLTSGSSYFKPRSVRKISE